MDQLAAREIGASTQLASLELAVESTETAGACDVGFACAFLATPYARRLSGGTQYIDGGVNIMA